MKADTEITEFSIYCFCPTPVLDKNDKCKCGTQWS